MYSILSNFFGADKDIISHIANAPGVPEEFMISKIVEMKNSGKYDYVIWDTPASSSTMHLLYLENDFYNHIGRDIRFYLKMKDTFKVSKTLDILEEWKDLAESVWNEVKSSNFYLVHTDDELAVVQSNQIRLDLKRLGINVSRTISNRTKTGGSDISVPEFNGTAREIAQKAMPFMQHLFETVHERRNL